MHTHYIDTHAHIHLMPLPTQQEVIERAKKAGLKKIVNVACNLKEIGQCLPLSDQHDFIFTSAGIHPTELGSDVEKDLERVEEYARKEKKIVAIGEIGLDYFHDKFDHDLQAAYLMGQLNIAKKLGLPAILHCRGGKTPHENAEAFKDMIEILKKEKFGNVVSHCFSGTRKEAKILFEMGAMLSFSGIVTYESNEELREVIKMAPLGQMLIETDSPFLTPQAHRGKKNEPAFVVEVAKTIAEVKGISLEKAAEITTENAEKFFKI